MISPGCPNCQYRFNCKITQFDIIRVNEKEKIARVENVNVGTAYAQLLRIPCAISTGDEVYMRTEYYNRVKEILFNEPEGIIDASWEPIGGLII